MMKRKENRKSGCSGPQCALIFAAGILLLAAVDQGLKYLASITLKGTEGVTLIPGILELQYLENRGMAFGMLQGKQILFLIFCLAFFALIIYIFVRIPKNRYFLPLVVTGVFLAGGAAGNFIDRLFRGYVVDFIYFSCIDFPIFNAADIFVVCGGIALVLLTLFRYQDGDFEFLSGKHRKTEN